MDTNTRDEVGFRVGDAVDVTLRSATAAEISAVSAQLGMPPGEPAASPHVLATYHEALEPRGPLFQVELGRFGWADDRFWWLRGLGGRRVRVTLDPTALGMPLHLDCERRGAGIPMLTQMLSTVAAAGGVVAVHAAAFRLAGRSVLVTGWSDAGKTEALLAALARGGEPIGDDIVYLDAATGELRGLPVAVRLKAWHVREMPQLRRRLGGAARLRVAGGRLSAGAARRLVAGPGGSAAARVTRRGAELVSRAFTARADLTTVSGTPPPPGPFWLDDVVLVTNSSRPGVEVSRADPHEVAARVQASLREERSNLSAAYRQLQFAFPGSHWELLEQVDGLESAALAEAFSRARVWRLDHPHPVTLSELGSALDRIVTA